MFGLFKSNAPPDKFAEIKKLYGDTLSNKSVDSGVETRIRKKVGNLAGRKYSSDRKASYSNDNIKKTFVLQQLVDHFVTNMVQLPNIEGNKDWVSYSTEEQQIYTKLMQNKNALDQEWGDDFIEKNGEEPTDPYVEMLYTSVMSILKNRIDFVNKNMTTPRLKTIVNSIKVGGKYYVYTDYTKNPGYNELIEATEMQKPEKIFYDTKTLGEAYVVKADNVVEEETENKLGGKRSRTKNIRKQKRSGRRRTKADQKRRVGSRSYRTRSKK